MAGPLTRRGLHSRMDTADYLGYIDRMNHNWYPECTYSDEDLLDYKLFFARKLKSIFAEQNQLRQHLVQIADLEWGLKQHYYIYGDEYRLGRLGDRYRQLQSRIRQMQDENSLLQSRTGLRLERYMRAQAALGDGTYDWCLPRSDAKNIFYETAVRDRRTRMNCVLENDGGCIPKMMCRAYSSSNSEQVYDRYEEEINALYEREMSEHVDRYGKSPQRYFHIEAPRMDSQDEFSKLEKPMNARNDLLLPDHGEDLWTATRVAQPFNRSPVVTIDTAVQVCQQDISSTCVIAPKQPKELSQVIPDVSFLDSRSDARNIARSISKPQPINGHFRSESSMNVATESMPATQMFVPEISVERSFSNTDKASSSEHCLDDSLVGRLSGTMVPQTMAMHKASLWKPMRNTSKTSLNDHLPNASSEDSSDVKLVPPPMTVPEERHDTSFRTISKTIPNDRFSMDSPGNASDVTLTQSHVAIPETGIEGSSANIAQQRRGDVSRVSSGASSRKVSGSSLCDAHFTSREETQQRTTNMLDRLDGDFKENLNKRQRKTVEKGRPVPAWADQIVEGIRRNLAELHDQTTGTDRENRRALSGDQEDSANCHYPDSAGDTLRSIEPRKQIYNHKKSRIPVRMPTKTFWYTAEDKDKILNNVKVCMLKDREFNIVSECIRHGKKRI